jgi:circadian clock protein KaiB
MSSSNSKSQPASKPVWVLRLYIAGKAPHSVQALENLEKLCSGSSLNGNCQVEIVDILEHPDKALADGIVVTPTLVRVEPLPVLKIIGNLSEHDKIGRLLGLAGDSP